MQELVRIGSGVPKQDESNRILVVDDEVVIRTLLDEILTEEGYGVTTAADGQAAVSLLDSEKFDLIITDIVMPGMNGIEVLIAALKVDPGYPVIMITGYPSVSTAVRLVNLGATDYITKPFNIDLIKVTVAKVLELRKVRPGSFTQRENSQSDQMVALDPLTDFYALNMFRRLLHSEIDRSERRLHVFGLLMLEIDKYESLYGDNSNGNGDTHKWASGPATSGDEVVKILAGILKQETRPGDILCRVDQAEFAVILPETERPEAEAIAQQIRRKVEWNFTLSAGIVCFPNDAMDADAMIQTARAAIKTAKARGGDAVFVAQ